MAYKGPKITSLHGDALKARIAHLVATHNTAAVPTKYLTGANAKYARERVKNINLDTPVTPGSALTNRDLAHEAQSTVATTYQPQEQGIATQQGQLVNQKANLPQYYQNYLDVLKGAQAQAGIDAKHTADNIQALGTSAQTAQTSGDTSALKALQSDAERLGVSADPKAAQDATNAAAASRSVSDAQAGTAQLLGQANANFLRMTQAGAGLAEQEGLGKIAAQQNQLAAQRTALKREEGQSNVAYRSKRRSEEVTNVATSALANVNAAAKAAGVQQGAQRVKVAQKNADTARRRQQQAGQPSTVARPPSNYPGSPADWNNLSITDRQTFLTKHPTSRGAAGNGKDQYGNTPQQRVSARSAYAKALRIAKVIGGNDPQQILLGLTQKFPSVNDTILAGAAQEAALGHVGPKTAAHLKRRGITGRPLAPASQQTSGGGATTYDKGARPG